MTLSSADIGSELLVVVPLAVFSEGASKDGVYIEGASLEGVFASSWVHFSAPDGSPVTSSLTETDHSGCGLFSLDASCNARP